MQIGTSCSAFSATDWAEAVDNAHKGKVGDMFGLRTRLAIEWTDRPKLKQWDLPTLKCEQQSTSCQLYQSQHRCSGHITTPAMLHTYERNVWLHSNILQYMLGLHAGTIRMFGTTECSMLECCIFAFNLLTSTHRVSEEMSAAATLLH